MQGSRSSASRRSSQSRSLLAGLLVCLTLLVVGGRVAHAQKRTAVPELEGDRRRAAHTAVCDVLGRKHLVLPRAMVDAARERVGQGPLTDETAARLAGATSADLVVSGTVRKQGKALVVTVTVRAADGRVIGTAESTARRGKLDDDFKDDLAAQLEPLADAPVPTKDAPADPEIEVAVDPAVDPEADAASETGAEGPSSTTATGTAAGWGAPPDRLAALVLTFGMPLVARDLDFTSRAGLTADQRPARYDGALVPGVAIELELYPLALGLTAPRRATWWRQFGLYASGWRTLLLTSRRGEAFFATVLARYEIGARWRWNVGGPDAPTAPTLELGVGLGQQAFRIDNGTTDLGLPDTVSSYVLLGLRARVPLGGPRLALFGGGSWLVVTNGGDINDATAYGPGTASGFDVEAGLELRPWPRVPVRAAFRMTQIRHTFEGRGTLANNRDGNPATVDITGATERLLGGMLTAGYLF